MAGNLRRCPILHRYSRPLQSRHPQEIEAQGWSLNPGRYVGVAKGEDLSDEDFKEQLEALNEALEVLNAEARELETRIAENVTELLEA